MSLETDGRALTAIESGQETTDGAGDKPGVVGVEEYVAKIVEGHSGGGIGSVLGDSQSCVEGSCEAWWPGASGGPRGSGDGPQVGKLGDDVFGEGAKAALGFFRDEGLDGKFDGGHEVVQAVNLAPNGLLEEGELKRGKVFCHGSTFNPDFWRSEFGGTQGTTSPASTQKEEPFGSPP